MVRAVSTPWRSLGLAASELKLAHTLPTGQAFGWVRVGDEYHGCLRDAGVALREHPVSGAAEWRCDASREAAAEAYVRDYFRADVSFAELYGGWSRADARFAKIAAVVDGARVLRQDPLECLVSFICSSNNNIQRIGGMLHTLRKTYGEVLPEGTAPLSAGGWWPDPRRQGSPRCWRTSRTCMRTTPSWT